MEKANKMFAVPTKVSPIFVKPRKFSNLVWPSKQASKQAEYVLVNSMQECKSEWWKQAKRSSSSSSKRALTDLIVMIIQ